MTRLVGADVDMTSSGYLAIRWCGLTHFVRLTAAEFDVFTALERVRCEEAGIQAAKSDGGNRGVTLRRAKAKAATA
jgi:hypothetical protein